MHVLWKVKAEVLITYDLTSDSGTAEENSTKNKKVPHNSAVELAS